MKATHIHQRLKPLMLPLAMLVGILFHDSIAAVEFLVPYLIFTMLLITFCKISPREFRFSTMTWSLLAVQLIGPVAVYYALLPFSTDTAQAAFICVLCPTATAAPVVTGMLGGDVGKLATFSIASNFTAAIAAPLLFSAFGTCPGIELEFVPTFIAISKNVAPLILLPLIVAFTIYFLLPDVHKAIGHVQSLSFYLWSVALIVAVGRSVSFAMSEPADKIPEMICIALAAGVVCVAQFAIGRRIGGACGDKISGAQGLGQKNTILAIWLALSYLNPIASIGPAAYVAWQNTINSAQLFLKARRDAAAGA